MLAYVYNSFFQSSFEKNNRIETCSSKRTRECLSWKTRSGEWTLMKITFSQLWTRARPSPSPSVTEPEHDRDRAQPSPSRPSLTEPEPELLGEGSGSVHPYSKLDHHGYGHLAQDTRLRLTASNFCDTQGEMNVRHIEKHPVILEGHISSRHNCFS